MTYYVLVIISVFSAACAQMLLKKGAEKQYVSLWRQYANIWVIGGYAIMGCAMLLNVFCLSRGIQIKEIGAIEALSYLFVPLLSWIFFKEKLNLRKIMAIGLIMLGIVVFFV